MYVNTLEDLYESMKAPNRNEGNSYCNSKKITIKIIQKYFSKIRELVLDGFDYDFTIHKDYYRTEDNVDSKNFGSIVINRRRALKDYTGFVNPRTIGFYFEIVHTWDLLGESKMLFKAGPSFRRKLTKYLRTGKRDYFLKENIRK